MSKKKKIIIIVGTLCALTVVCALLWKYYPQCVPLHATETSAKKVSKKEYLEIGNRAVESLPEGASQDDKYRAKYNAIYQAVFNNEADELSKDIDIDDSSIGEMMQTDTYVKISKVLVLENQNETWRYYIYSDQSLTVEAGDNFLGYTVKSIEEPTDEEQKSYVVKTAKSVKLVDKINGRVEEILK